MFKLILLILISINLFSMNLIEEFNNIVKQDKVHENIVFEYNKYVFEEPKEVIKFFRLNKEFNAFNIYFEKLNTKNKELFIEYMIDDSKNYKDFIKGINLYSKLFIPTILEAEQDLQFHIYNLLIDNKKAYYDIIEYSNVEDHYLSIFNPSNLVKLSNRYKYFTLMFANKGFLISYPNAIDYIVTPNHVIQKIEEYGLKENYDNSINHYMKIESVVEIPFFIRTILLDRANQQKTIEFALNISFESKLNDFINNIQNISFYAKNSHDFLMKFLNNSSETRLKEISHKKNINEFEEFTTIDFSYDVKSDNLLNYMNGIKLTLDHIKINDKHSLHIKVNDKYGSKVYRDVKLFLEENSIEYIY